MRQSSPYFFVQRIKTKILFYLNNVKDFFYKFNKLANLSLRVSGRVCIVAATTAVFLLLFLPLNTMAITANITKIEFITDTQTVKPGEVSKMITIQAQNSSGVKEELDTSGTKLDITSSSPTGQFSTNGTSWDFTNPLTVNKTWYGRNVYYKDNSSGDFTLTAKMTAGLSVWTTTQIIKISNQATEDDTGDTGGDSDQNTNGTSTATTTETQNQTSTTTIVYKYISVHSNPENLSSLENNPSLSISAGRDRLTYVGCPIKFSAKTPSSQNVYGGYHEWSFGDGAVSNGETVEHVYRYPGIYNVVLNSRLADKTGTARSVVKVLNPELSLIDFNNESFEIKNYGNVEINLDGWSVVVQNSRFRFPQDTIVGAGQSLRVSSENSKLHLVAGVEKASLFDPSYREKSTFNFKKELKQLSQNIIVTDKQVKDLISSLTAETLINISEYSGVEAKSDKEKENFSFNDPLIIDDYGENNEQSASALNSIAGISATNTSEYQAVKGDDIIVSENTASVGFWKTLWSVPKNTWKSFASFFYPSL